MTINLQVLDESVLGTSTPDPLRFAFEKKRSAHAGGRSQPPLSQEQLSEQLKLALSGSELNPNKKRCLYVHIPFCRVRCTFCNFFQNAASRKLVDEYFSALLVELEHKAKQPWTQSGAFHAVYIGGGTPTDLSSEQIRILGTRIRTLFPLTTDCEITLEGRINRFSDEMFENALEGGFNRFSFGVQSFNTLVRRTAKRLDDREVVLNRLSELSRQDEAPIVIDLLYGLPHQDRQVFEQDLNDYLETGAHGIDLYQLMVGGSAPMINLVEKGKMPPPATTPEKAELFAAGVSFMDKHHMRRLSVNHWALDNRERSLYNSIAKTSAEVLPVGCGAGGHLSGYSLMNVRMLDQYLKRVKSGEPTAAMMMPRSKDADLHDEIKAGFDAGVLAARNLEKLGYSGVFEWLEPLFKHWESNGLVERDGRYLQLTLAGSFWSVTLAQGVIQALQTYENAASVA
ncbi:Coproporphyrinogen oxidase homolog PhuW [Vibrio nigripulchritudo MADA3029]|uniref:heme anaerobic degradation radical SAM methyltransferase ChuW/HutW n=1 Tax=Vibrio nigripulchritudo TaxID=28173 RepID=UPI0003B19C2E|nr:heme anaerobic degradation radical SAM methyltransferase ChuW/HutW [Vibrio nigripulchritudo]KJY81171.1 coproporphyrinogen III oxidase [Vibrio nigripulchritudo]CCN48274.1 Coproporphyrinogen oxidase homolog PhuW [Vibrio nigripulchritudo MADA3020]CCN54896.1 Coproporphyrinogen oxidase homolog PhuW [Vibrio nigripulchritudo MADA3021]CCN58229.1 Coproporphyrinogen oxidase homolog PhuW [Vibrio nigripulchritudo MADA3029]